MYFSSSWQACVSRRVRRNQWINFDRNMASLFMALSLLSFVQNSRENVNYLVTINFSARILSNKCDDRYDTSANYNSRERKKIFCLFHCFLSGLRRRSSNRLSHGGISASRAIPCNEVIHLNQRTIWDAKEGPMQCIIDVQHTCKWKINYRKISIAI